MSEALAERPSPGAADPRAGGVARPLDGTALVETLVLLLRDVAREESGLDVIYQALDAVRRAFGLADAMVAVEDETLGLQVFRLERQPIGPAELERVRSGEPFVSAPDVVPPEVQHLVGGIAAVAVAQLLAARRQVRDPVTGLLSRALFNEALRAAAAQSSRYGWTFTVLVLRAGSEERTSEVRRIGHAFARALRSGDTGTRLRRSTFAALLPNATADSLHAFVRRFLDESGCPADAVPYASATAPNESVDPAELFRLAASRLHGE